MFDEFNMVQPDVFVGCRRNKITGNNSQGVSDLIIEAVSSDKELNIGSDYV